MAVRDRIRMAIRQVFLSLKKAISPVMVPSRETAIQSQGRRL